MKPFLGTQERVRNSHGKRAISVRAIEVLLYMVTYEILTCFLCNFTQQRTYNA